MKKLMTSRNLITSILCFLLAFTLLAGSFAFGETDDEVIIEDEITEEDRKWAQTHICITDGGVDEAYLKRLAKKYDEARKKNPDVPYGGF